MNPIQYNKCLPYKEICSIFAKHGEYIGGADGLFQYYKDEFNAGNPVNTSCPSCVGAVLIHVNQMINEYERNMSGM